MRKVKRSKDAVFSNKVIAKLIDEHKVERERILKLKDYYNNKNDIANRAYKLQNKPQNRLSNPYASYITNMATGYLLGKPIAYKNDDTEASTQNDSDVLLTELNNTFKYNDEVDNNMSLAKEASICGYAYELLYTDVNANVRFKVVPSEQVIVVYDNTLDEDIILAIRYYTEKNDKDEDITKIEVYDTSTIKYYTLDGDTMTQDGEDKEHFFNDIPVSVYLNNDELYGDFEKVKDLIDAYDKTQSDSANDFEMFTHAMLVVSGYLVNEEEANVINELNVINFTGSDGKAEYLIKNIQDTALENYKNRLNQDIHRFSQVPALDDKEFTGNSSGISLSYKLLGLDNITSIKEAKFKKGLMRRIELICNYGKIKKPKLFANFTNIVPVFTRNKPVNDLEIADMVQKLSGIVSVDTLLASIPIVDNVPSEKLKLEAEQNSLYTNDYSNFNEKDDKKSEIDASLIDTESVTDNEGE